jgi:hypothetical protein
LKLLLLFGGTKLPNQAFARSNCCLTSLKELNKEFICKPFAEYPLVACIQTFFPLV